MQPEGEGMVIDDKSWQPWYKCYISYLTGPTRGAARHGYRSVSIIYPIRLVQLVATRKSGLSNHKEWVITFQPWLLPRIQVIVVPWLSSAYVICTLSAVLCIPEGEAQGNTH